MSLFSRVPLGAMRLLVASLAVAVAPGCDDARTPTTAPATVPAHVIYPGDPDPSLEPGMSACGNPTRLVINDFGLGVTPIKAGEANAFTLDAYDAAGNRISFSCAIKWTIGDTYYAFIDGSSTNSSAYVRGKAPGRTSLTVAYGGLTLTRSINVDVGNPSRVVISPASLSLKPGTGAQLTGTIFDKVGNRITQTKLLWTSDHPDAVRVSSYDYDGITASVGVPNPAVPPYSAKITAMVKDWPVGATIQVYVTDVPQCQCPPGVTCTCYPADWEPVVVIP